MFIGSTAYFNYNNMHRSKVSTPYETYSSYHVIWNISDLDLAMKKDCSIPKALDLQNCSAMA